MTFKRALGRFDAAMVVIGGIIGSGIFINPYIVAGRLDSTLLVLTAWATGGAIALVGALAYAELGSIFPRVGGQYAYLRDGFHPLAGFLYGWALLSVIESGAIAAVAIAFATYTLRLIGQAQRSPTPLAIAALLVLSAINFFGVKPGSRVLNVLVVLKVVALVVLIAFGFFAPAHLHWWSETRVASAADGSVVVAFGAALVPILFAYGGWQNANYVAEEIEDPVRNLPISLIAGTIAVVAIYVLVNIVYLRALGLEGLASTTTPAADAARRMFGSLGDRFVTAAIAISTFGFLDLAILAPTRVYYAMARDGLFVPALAKLHPTYGTPAVAIAGHRVVDARRRKNREIEKAERRDRDGRGDEPIAERSKHPPRRVGGRRGRGGKPFEPERAQVDDVHEHVDRHDRDRPGDDADRQVASWILDFFRDVVGVLPSAIREQDRHQRRAESDDAGRRRSDATASAPPVPMSQARRSRRAIKRAKRADLQNHQHVEHAAAGLHAEEVDDRQDEQRRDRERHR